jgi:hypothetical protein
MLGGGAELTGAVEKEEVGGGAIEGFSITWPYFCCKTGSEAEE